jgi:hypothetical protein
MNGVMGRTPHPILHHSITAPLQDSNTPTHDAR